MRALAEEKMTADQRIYFDYSCTEKKQALSYHDNISITKAIMQLLFVSIGISTTSLQSSLDHPFIYKHF